MNSNIQRDFQISISVPLNLHFPFENGYVVIVYTLYKQAWRGTMFQRNHMVEVEELALNEERQKDHRQVLRIIDGSWEFHMWYFVPFVTICTIYKTWKTLLVKLQAEASHITVFNLNSTNFKALTRICAKKVKSNKGHVPSSASIKFRWGNELNMTAKQRFFSFRGRWRRRRKSKQVCCSW